MTDIPKGDPTVERELHRNPVRTVAVVILVDKDSNILLTQTKRLPNQWQPIGGGVQGTDSSPEAAAVREAREEFGLELQAQQLRKVFETGYDFGDGLVHFFVSPMPPGATLHEDRAEIAALQWVSLQRALSLPMFPATAKCLGVLRDHSELLSSAARLSRLNSQS